MALDYTVNSDGTGIAVHGFTISLEECQWLWTASLASKSDERKTKPILDMPCGLKLITLRENGSLAMGCLQLRYDDCANIARDLNLEPSPDAD